MTSAPDTIVALATPPARAAISVLRLSGPGVAGALRALCARLPSPRRASLRKLRRADGAILDEALVLWFPAPASFTGEDSAELHLHGGTAVADAVLTALLGLGLRLAEPGEFTRRAFERGRLDLAQAEAIADLVDAETDSQRRQALAQLDGALSARHGAWRAALIEALSSLEAAVDFPDEDLPAAVVGQARAPIIEVAAALDAALADGGRGERVREGYRIALVGAPNAGKSSLLNALVRSEAAIVTATPGTTRDVIEVTLDLGGYRVLLADTAGLRDSEDPVEAEGVRRARGRAEQADLRLLLVDGAADSEDWRVVEPWGRRGDLCLLNKADLAPGRAAERARSWAVEGGLTVLSLSLVEGDGLIAVEALIAERVAAALGGAEFPAATRARHRRDLEDALKHLRRAETQMGGTFYAELAAEDVRLAARCLERVTGRIDAEQVLDRVFARFCIGK